ncbi:hypothetical protein ACI0X9_003320 [Cronobacter turicensis]
MAEMIEIIDALGSLHHVAVLARLTQKIDGQMLGFVVHKSFTINRLILSHEKSGKRIAVLDGADIRHLGIEGAGHAALQSFVNSVGEKRAANVVLS